MHLQILWSFALRLQNFVISFWKWINSSWMTHNRSLPFLKTGYFDFIVMFIFININNFFIIWEKCVCFYILCITKTQTSHVRKLRFEAKINCIKSRATKHMTSGENKKKRYKNDNDLFHFNRVHYNANDGMKSKWEDLIFLNEFKSTLRLKSTNATKYVWHRDNQIMHIIKPLKESLELQCSFLNFLEWFLFLVGLPFPI